MEMLREGNVKWFCKAKGYGFITCPEIETDIFVHYKDVLQYEENEYIYLLDGQKVWFYCREKEDGKIASTIVYRKDPRCSNTKS